MTSVTGSAFSVAIRGQIANVTLPQLAGMDVACKYSYEVGPDWQVASGLEEGFSQVIIRSLFCILSPLIEGNEFFFS